MKSLVLAAVMFALSATCAAAQKIDPRCAKMRDKIGCTCALQNGGHILPQGRWTANRPGQTRGTNAGHHLNEEFYKCNMRYRGRSG
jgi:hypothetical protein